MEIDGSFVKVATPYRWARGCIGGNDNPRWAEITTEIKIKRVPPVGRVDRIRPVDDELPVCEACLQQPRERAEQAIAQAVASFYQQEWSRVHQSRASDAKTAKTLFHLLVEFL